MKIIESILTKNPCYKAGRKITVEGLMLHSIGCPQPNAKVFVKGWNSESHNNSCVHAFIDGITGKIYQTLPWNHRAWHCGSGSKGSGNNTHIGVEMCEPDYIRYVKGSFFACTDVEKAVVIAKRTYKAAVELFAYLCEKYALNPLEDGVIISHAEGHKRGIASNHGDPEHLWTQLDLGYTMDTFRKDVSIEMKKGDTESTQKTETEEFDVDPLNGFVKIIYEGADGVSIRKAPKFGDEYIVENQKTGTYTVVGITTDKKFYKLKSGKYITTGEKYVKFTARLEEKYSLKDFVKDVQRVTGAKVDGIAGKETLEKTVTLAVLINHKHPAVKFVQKRLNALGFDCGEADGVFGEKTYKAVKAFQKANNCVNDGVITMQNMTWKKLLGMA